MIAIRRHSFLVVSALALCLLLFKSSQAAQTSDVMHDVPVTVPSAPGSVRIETHIDRSTAQIAEPITMSLAVTAPKGVTITFPEPSRLADPGTTFGVFDVVKVDDRFDIPDPTDADPTARLWTRTYTLECLTAGSHVIPPVAVQTTDRRMGEAVHDTVASQAETVQIISLVEGQTDATQFRDIKGAVSLAEPAAAGSSWLWAVTGTALLFLIAAIGLVAWHWRGGPLSADAWALAELDRIERHAAAGESVQEIYFDVTNIVRHYIEHRFGLNAPRLTTREFLSAVQHGEALISSHRAPLQEFLTRADMVKFACLEPTAAEAIATIGQARHFVTQTAQQDDSDQETPKTSNKNSKTGISQSNRSKAQVYA